MEEHSVSGSDAPKTRLKKDFVGEWRALASFLMKRVLKFAMWVTFIAWLAVWFLYPSTKFEYFFVKVIKIGGGTFYGILGGVFALFNAPLLVIIFLAIIYLAAFPREYHETQQPKSIWFRLWTFPVLTHGPLGVVSASEFIGILVFAAYFLWAFSVYTVQNHRMISKMSLPSKEKSYLMLENTALRLASIGLTCMEFLFLPITRGSVLLRLIDIPVEHATRYHVWLGHAMMVIFTSHGLCYMVSWTLQGHLLQKIVKWNCNDFSYLPGLLTLLTGLLIWVTSLHRVRVRHFELFYYTHQLYALFILFLALHIGDSLISVAIGGIFFFLVDRFLRFCQSRKAVSILSATTLPCGTVELVLSKPANLHYNALSFIFLRVPEISRMQWHPFSVSSSPLDGNHHLSVLLKVLGGWTGELSNLVTNISHQPHKSLQLQSNPHIMASVEGPYGHDLAYHLTYKNLILIAGGIGMSPFLAILRDILHRIRENKPCSPTNILVIWSVKTSKELSLLSLVDADSICPSFSMKLKLEIQTYVTQEFSPAVLEDGNHLYKRSMNNPSCHMANKRSMSNLVGTGNNIWSGVYVIISTVGFAILVGLMQAFYITPSHVSCWWFKGLLFILCMTASVVLFGGPVIMLWHLWQRKFSGQGESICGNEDSKCTRNGESNIQTREYPPDLARSLATTQYGCRPNFRAIFNSASNGLGKVDVGVIVCGPPSLQSSVAAECMSQSIRSRWTHTTFHLHIHSFDL